MSLKYLIGKKIVFIFCCHAVLKLIKEGEANEMNP